MNAPASAQSAPAFLVAIGASAGGLSAFKALLPGLPRGLGAAYVLLQHLDPDHPSLLAELLAEVSPFPIHPIEDGMTLLADTLYLCPAGRQCELSDGVFRLQTLRGHGPRHSIDRLLTSVARHYPDRCTGIILSGAGNDGLQGIREIKNNGGWALAEDPGEAEYGSMPRSLVDHHLADIVGPAAGLGGQLAEILRLASEQAPAFSLPEHADELRVLLNLLEQETGFDFHRYKENMLARRINRRLLANRIGSLADYLTLVRHSRAEARALLKDIFINVTGFFRDQPVYRHLETLLRERLATPQKEAVPAGEFRVWSAGCATGEEAYSLALLLAELRRAGTALPTVKIFATDIDPDNIAVARQGEYGAKAVANLPAEWLSRYFEPSETGYRVGTELREMVVFAVHDVNEDAPFSRLDLLVCRNLLIYFGRTVQEHLLARFHYALKEDGWLLLGNSESVGPAMHLFQPLEPGRQLYRRLPPPAAAGPSRPPPAPAAGTGTVNPRKAPGPSHLDQMLTLYFREYAPAAALLNGQDELVHLHGATQAYFSLPSGDVRMDIVHLARPPLRADMRLVVRQARREGKPIRSRPIPLPRDEASGATRLDAGDERVVILAALPARSASGEAGADDVLLVFEEQRRPARDTGEQGDGGREAELAATREQLLAANEALESAHQELNGLKIEFQTAREELQAANEEFQTSNEELQSANEELISVNEELRARSLELDRAYMELDHVLNNALSGMIVLDRNLQVIRHSANCPELFGLASDGPDCKSQLTARLQGLPRLAAWLQETITEGRGRQRELDLNERHFQLRLIPVPEPDSDAVHSLILTFYDETLRRQQEQESRLLAAIVRSSADAIIVHDEAGNILSWNTGAANMYGYSESEAQARAIEDIIDKGSRRAYRTFLDGLLRGETPGALELQGLDRDGRPLDISLNASVLQGPPGESRRVALIQRDITEKNATEQKLNALVESTPDPIIIVEADGTIQRVNRQAETLFGYSRRQLLGSSYKILIPERYRAHHDLYHKQFQSKPVMRDMGSGLELSCLNAAGEEIPVEIGLSPVVVQDEATTLVRFRDVRKARQEQRILREAKQAADEANRTKSRFLAAASHDLRQPLQSISMYLGVLAGELAAPDKAKVVDQARMALDTTNKLLNSLLNITKLESGKVQPEITAFPVRDMLARVYNTESPHAREKHHHFALVQSSAVVSSDPALLEQLVTNLVGNAIKYTPEHGHIVLGCRRQGRFIKVQVSDNGPGIASEELDVIFDEYRQLEYNGHYLGKGLGLGLSIVKLIAELLHLQMEVKSTPGKGSSFSVLVPAGAPSAPRAIAAETEAAPSPVASGTLLLVEDDLAVLESTSLFLELAGYQVVTARSSAHAMEAVETVQPDLIISDFGLGENMNGIQVVEALRQRLGREVPGIIVTGDTSDQRAQEALDAGCRIVRKPIEAHLLQRSVQDLL